MLRLSMGSPFIRLDGSYSGSGPVCADAPDAPETLVYLWNCVHVSRSRQGKYAVNFE